MVNENNKMSEEDYLKKHLNSIENGNSPINTDIPFVEKKIDVTTSDLQYFNIDIKELPCGSFYPTGSILMVRPAKVKEIQAYSMVDDSNLYDIVEKMNDMLQSCARIKYPDGKIGSYLEIKDQDRLYVIFLIRELTFQQGNSLSVKVPCTCGEEINIELKRENFEYHKIDEKLEEFFSISSRSYHFDIVNNKHFELAPPTIGMQKAFTDYILKENAEKRTPNMSFLKIIPFTLVDRVSITYEGIKAKLSEYEDPNKMDDISFQFLNAAVNKMTFGIKELKRRCLCGEEVHTDMQFPNGASSIFVISDAFDTYLKK